MTALALYLRSRGVAGGVLCGMPAMVVVARLGVGYADPQRAVIAACLALALGLAVLGHGLGGHDDALDRTAALRWSPRRALHLAAATALATTVVAAVTTAPTGVVLRDAVGFAGLTALAVALFGRRLAWVLPVAVGCVSAGVPAGAEPFALFLLTWATQPATSSGATLVAAVCGLAGAAAYLIRGPGAA